MHNKKILIVDDDDAFLNLLAKLIEQLDIKVEFELNVEKAIERLHLNKFQYIIADYRMPKIDGIEFLMHAKGIQPSAIRVLLSGMADLAGMQSKIKKAGIHRIIDKHNCFVALNSMINHSRLSIDECRETS